MADQALADVVVLDLTQQVSGPYCTKLLADYGAEVIKVEPPGSGDPSRRLGPFYHDTPHPEGGAVFLHYNTGKKSLTLDITTDTGRSLLRKLAQQADILVENSPPGALERLGLGQGELRASNPRLVYTSISPYGQTGPYRDYAATDMTVFAMGGIMYRHGEPDRDPLRYPGHIIQCLAGVNAAAATMCALLSSRLTGQGAHIDISTMECLAGAVDRQLLRYAYGHESAVREGHRREGWFPNGIYPCADGFVHIGTLLSARGWVRVARMLDMPDLLTDPQFATPAARREHHGEFDAIFYPWLVEHTREEIFRLGQAQRVMVGMVYTMDEVLRDPQYRHRNYFTALDHPVVGQQTYPGAPFRMSETPGRLRPAPLLSEHTEQVLCERLSCSREDLARLRAAGVV
ncbi:MAG: CoA transferase [Chloroflexi bacterium]|nr:CoA transferase [Chloroflexota bacterium]